MLDDESVTVIFGDAYGELPEPTREGYTFDGWYTAETGGELVEADTEVSDKSDHTLYAHWTLTKVFSVTVPAGLPLAVTEDGVVTASTDAAIANNSTCDVRVTGISLRTENGWTLCRSSTTWRRQGGQQAHRLCNRGRSINCRG